MRDKCKKISNAKRVDLAGTGRGPIGKNAGGGEKGRASSRHSTADQADGSWIGTSKPRRTSIPPG